MDKHTIPLQEALRAILLKRLLIPFVISAILILGGAALYSGQLVERQQLQYAQSIARTVSQFLSQADYDLKSISSFAPGSTLAAIEKNMAANIVAHRNFDTIYFLDETKRIITLTPADPRYDRLDMSRRKYFADINCEDVNFSTPFTSLRSGRYTVYLTRCTADGRYLVSELNLNTLQESISNAHGTVRETTYIVDSRGNLLAHPNFQLVEQQTNLSNSAIVQKGFNVGDISSIYWHNKNLWIGSVSTVIIESQINHTPEKWYVIAEVPLLAVYGPYIIAIITLSAVFMSIFYLSLRVVLLQLQRKLVTPLSYLTRHVDMVAHGNYAATEIRLDDTIPFVEISSLLANFRNMRNAIITRETDLRKSEEQYRRLLENSPDAILLHHNAIIFYVNAAAIKLYAAQTAEQLLGKNILEIIHPDSLAQAKARLQKLEEKEQVLPFTEMKNVRLDQSLFDAEATTSSITFAGGVVAQTIVRDITQRKNEEEALKYRATHDPLTDLPNRFLFQDRLNHALTHAKRNQNLGAVLYLDLDSFKAVNDTYGHGVGDQTLRHFAASLQTLLREGDTVARLSGDEFVILLENLKEPLDAEMVANNVLRAFTEPYLIEGKEVFISFSVGISIFPGDGTDTETLLQSADAAMYQAKEEGKHRAKFYAPYMRAQSLERITLLKYLSHALEEQQFFLQYQPQVNYQTGKIVGVEALLRWRHPALGLVSPGKFIPIAEETGLILPIGEWVLKTACEQISQWQTSEMGGLPIAVNLSNLQLKQPDISQIIKRAILAANIPPELLEIELMENIVFRNADSSFSNLYDIKSIGVNLAMDDFGAGFSTLGYLAHIPFDRIKIDQHLVANIENAKDAAVVSGIITICNNLNLEVLAEGVETSAQLDFCVSKGCNYFQGWYYSRAVDSTNIKNYVTDGVPWKNKIPPNLP